MARWLQATGVFVGLSVLAGSCVYWMVPRETRAAGRGVFVVSGRAVGYSPNEEVRIVLNPVGGHEQDSELWRGTWLRTDKEGRFSFTTPTVTFLAASEDRFSLVRSAHATVNIRFGFRLGFFREGYPPLLVYFDPVLEGLSDLGTHRYELPDIDLSQTLDKGSCGRGVTKNRSGAIVAGYECTGYNNDTSSVTPGCEWLALDTKWRVCLDPAHSARRDVQTMRQHLAPILFELDEASNWTSNATLLTETYRRANEALSGGFWWLQQLHQQPHRD